MMVDQYQSGQAMGHQPVGKWLNENGKFRASFLASSTNGTFKNSQLDKYIGTFNGQYKFLDKKIGWHTLESQKFQMPQVLKFDQSSSVFDNNKDINLC